MVVLVNEWHIFSQNRSAIDCSIDNMMDLISVVSVIFCDFVKSLQK